MQLNLNNWRLPMKLWAIFSFINIVVAIVAVNGYVSARNLDGVAQRHVSRGIAGMSDLADVISNAKELRIALYNFYIADATDTQNAQMAEMRADLQSQEAALKTSLETYSKVAGDDFAGHVDELRLRLKTLSEANARFIRLHETGQDSAALDVLRGESHVASDAVINQIDKIIDYTRARSDKAAEEGGATASLSINLTIVLGLIATSSIVAIWFFLNRNIAAPITRITHVTTKLAEGGQADVPYLERGDEIGEIANAVEQFHQAAEARAAADARTAAEQQIVTTTLRESLQAISAGDLTQAITIDFPPAYAELKDNFNASLVSLRELISAVAESALAIRIASSEIAQASEDLARRTESNAASLEETSAAITQMDERLRVTAQSAGRTVERADGAMSVIDSGRNIANQAVAAMGRVSESAKGIDSVIEGLDKIAFQTRVLAMNAAVEAGRAGDAGRGFAVVADLVSALAMRSEEEAKRAREQLTATQTDIGSAVEAVQRVDGALENISGDVTEVNTLLRDIAIDNQAQSSTITEISATIGTMDQATQQNAAMVEETSAAARNLNNEVTALSDRAAMFRVGNTPAPTRTVQPPKLTSHTEIPVRSTFPQISASDDDWMDF